MRVKSRDNLRALGTLLIGGGDAAQAFGKYEGKNAVLALVAAGIIDPKKPASLDGLFSPAVPPASRPRAADYAAVTPESLETKTFPHLTSYERVAEPEGGWKGGERPLIADFTSPDTVLVFFTNGQVRELSREEWARL